MLEKYPQSDKAAAANLKKALAFVQLNQIGQGIEQLRFVTANYPGPTRPASPTTASSPWESPRIARPAGCGS